MRIVPDSQVIFYANVDIVPGEQHLAPQSETARDAYFASKVAAHIPTQAWCVKTAHF